MENAAERARKALDALVYLPSLKGQTSRSEGSTNSPATGASHHPCRTWDRGDLLRRLHSFKSSTWFCKPAGAGPVECARRGWVNHSMDMLSCEFCRARLSLPLPPTLPPEEIREIGREFSARLASAHDSGCPWRTAACDPSLAQFPPLDRSVVAAGFADRATALGRLNVLPPVSEDAYARINTARRSRLQQLLVQGPQRAGPRLQIDVPDSPCSPAAGNGVHTNGSFQGFEIARQPEEPSMSSGAVGSQQPSSGIACQGTPEFTRRQRLLALCGWEVLQIHADSSARSAGSPSAPGSIGRDNHRGDAVLDATGAALCCEMCGARAGLWDFVPRMVPAARSGSRLITAGLSGRDRSPPVAARSVDLSKTIAGGSLSPDQAPPSSSSSPGPFGSASMTPLAFGVPTPSPAPQGQSSQQQQQQGSGKGDNSFSFPVLPAAAGAAAPLPMAFPAEVPTPQPQQPSPPIADPFSPRGAKSVQAFDPLLFHRTFCPWVNTGTDTGSSPGGKPGRCGWRWCLDSLVPSPGPEEERDSGAGEDQRSKVAAAIRKLRA
ncbi:zf-C3HC-domain-containing protein [Coccomyxa subellipsoidea C-169]|uniref:Zf-C3HC-domain-containing protein n=1 Tax=Coccomyxa subellipsoidea (strain C-169) TaxID=574566 RepID=I0YUG1_COCSC|nr:zf-C3HC-domain-containing protein [Coccomyxa subellipsoidea C-169]EIE22030.1 zf-C3HC-domain-containing protein [Coccomyxa subellipsoidea C-169]|eukprot:XP_005646574.1 zf-C3HC-domain-containing protein [Coccomyxa subellipsoidea C-169]